MKWKYHISRRQFGRYFNARNILRKLTISDLQHCCFDWLQNTVTNYFGKILSISKYFQFVLHT